MILGMIWLSCPEDLLCAEGFTCIISAGSQEACVRWCCLFYRRGNNLLKAMELVTVRAGTSPQLANLMLFHCGPSVEGGGLMKGHPLVC